MVFGGSPRVKVRPIIGQPLLLEPNYFPPVGQGSGSSISITLCLIYSELQGPLSFSCRRRVSFSLRQLVRSIPIRVDDIPI